MRYGLGLYTLIATVLLTEFAAEKTNFLLNQERRNIKRGLWIGGIRLAKWTYLACCWRNYSSSFMWSMS